MHERRYTEDHARRLVPILRSILIEVGERAQAIAGLEKRLASKLTRAERNDAEALLASHRRETRRHRRATGEPRETQSSGPFPRTVRAVRSTSSPRP